MEEVEAGVGGADGVAEVVAEDAEEALLFGELLAVAVVGVGNLEVGFGADNEFSGVEGLVDVVNAADLEGLNADFGVAVGGEEDYGDLAAGWVLAEALADLNARFFLQNNIEEIKIRGRTSVGREKCIGIVKNGDFTV